MSDVKVIRSGSAGEENRSLRDSKSEVVEKDVNSDDDTPRRVIPVEATGKKETECSDDSFSHDDWSDNDDEIKGPVKTTDVIQNVEISSDTEEMDIKDKASKKKKLKKAVKKKKKLKTIGRTIELGDKSYELMFDMLLGIRISVSGVTAKKKPSELTRNDIREIENYFVPSSGTIHTPAHPGRDFKFRDYAPKVFRDLRERNGIDSADYLISLTGDYVLSEIVSPGKSGSFFYFSHDTLYMLKTITTGEKQFFKKILRAYYLHVVNNPDTLVIRFYGFHMVQPHGGSKMHFVVMGNIFAQSLEIHERYDLKGSTIGRTVGDEKLRSRKPTTILKDLDFQTLSRSLNFGPKKREIFFAQIDSDCEFLEKQDIMDYSLLLGIHFVSEEETKEEESSEEDPARFTTIFTRDHGGFAATDEANNTLPEIYFLGIIDILQPYNITKQVENRWKSNVLRMSRFEISSVSPTLYANRFARFIKNHTSNCSEADANANLARTRSQMYEERPTKLRFAHSFTHALRNRKSTQAVVPNTEIEGRKKKFRRGKREKISGSSPANIADMNPSSHNTKIVTIIDERRSPRIIPSSTNTSDGDVSTTTNTSVIVNDANDQLGIAYEFTNEEGDSTVVAATRSPRGNPLRGLEVSEDAITHSDNEINVKLNGKNDDNNNDDDKDQNTEESATIVEVLKVQQETVIVHHKETSIAAKPVDFTARVMREGEKQKPVKKTSMKKKMQTSFANDPVVIESADASQNMEPLLSPKSGSITHVIQSKISKYGPLPVKKNQSFSALSDQLSPKFPPSSKSASQIPSTSTPAPHDTASVPILSARTLQKFPEREPAKPTVQVEVDDQNLFDVRVPKRKRVIEKSKLDH